MNQPSSNQAPRKKRILVVDDEPSTSAVVVCMLRENGFDAWAVDDPAQVEARIAELSPDLVLMDYEMPGLTGPEVSVQLKSKPATRQLPIVFLSGQIDGDHCMAGAFSGSEAYLTKPVNEFVLVGVIRRILAGRKPATV